VVELTNIERISVDDQINNYKTTSQYQYTPYAFKILVGEYLKIYSRNCRKRGSLLENQYFSMFQISFDNWDIKNVFQTGDSSLFEIEALAEKEYSPRKIAQCTIKAN